MNLDEAVRHVREGTATKEEKQFIREQLEAVNQEMDFDEAIGHVREGTATAEEMAYVKRKLGFDSDEDEKQPPAPIAEADKREIKQAKKKFKFRYVVIPFVVIVCIIAVLGAILGGVFGYAATSAKKAMKYDNNACVQVAENYLTDYLKAQYPDIVIGQIRRDGKVDRDFSYNDSDLSKSYYICIVELKGNARVGNRMYEVEAEISVDTRTGDARMLDFDFDD